jgi:hypothetical protein
MLRPLALALALPVNSLINLNKKYTYFSGQRCRFSRIMLCQILPHLVLYSLDAVKLLSPSLLAICKDNCRLTQRGLAGDPKLIYLHLNDLITYRTYLAGDLKRKGRGSVLGRVYM